MADFAVRLAAVAGAVLLLPPAAMSPDVAAAERSASPLRPSVADFVLLANDGALPVQSGEVLLITATTPALPLLAPAANDDVTETQPSLASLLGASSVTDLGQAVPAKLPGGPAIPPEFLGLDAGGLTAEYFTSADLTRLPALQQAQPSSVVRLPVGATAARVTGQVTIPVDGTYEFTLTATGAARMLVDGVEVANLANEDEPGDQATDAASNPPTSTVTMDLTAGTVLPLQFEMVDESSPEPVLALGWRPPAEVASAALEEAANAAATAGTVLIHVPSLPARTPDSASPAAVAGALPLDLAGLLTRVAASNPRIVVVMDAAADDELDWTASAVLHVPTGIVDLESLARVLTGEAQPSGTLAFALPLPHGPPLPPEELQADAVPPAPLYPAGHGLTYWNYQLLSIAATPYHSSAIDAVVEVAATGTAPGATNLYVAATTADSQQLHPVGSVAVEVAAGETASVTIPLDLSALDLDSPDAWPVTLHAGTSPDALTTTAELAASEISEAPSEQQAEKPKKQPKQGGIVRPAVPGLALTTGAGAVTLENAVEVDGRLRLTGTLPTVSVSDARPGTGTGWTVSARASDLSGPGGSLPASNLGWAPIVLTAADGVTAGPPVAGALSGGQGLGESAVLGHAPRPVGTVQFGADFVLEIPATTVPGNYTGTLTVTLFPIE